MANSKIVLADGRVLLDISMDTAVESDVASGMTFHKADGTQGIGTNTNDVDSSGATALESEVAAGKTFAKGGTMHTGTAPLRGGQTGYISDKDTPVQILNGLHDGSGSVGIDDTEKAKLIPGNIKDGVQILGVQGSYSGEGVTAQAKSVTPYLSAQTVLPDSGYDYLSQVSVGAIEISYADNPGGGKTVTIGSVAPA